jgi:hypothetical protein
MHMYSDYMINASDHYVQKYYSTSFLQSLCLESSSPIQPQELYWFLHFFASCSVNSGSTVERFSDSAVGSVNNGRAVERFCDSAVGFLLLNQLTVDGQRRGFLIQPWDSLEPFLPSSRLFGYVSLLVMCRNPKWLPLLDRQWLLMLYATEVHYWCPTVGYSLQRFWRRLVPITIYSKKLSNGPHWSRGFFYFSSWGGFST